MTEYSVEHLKTIIEISCEKLSKKKNFDIEAYLEGLKNKYKTMNNDSDDEKKEKENISLLVNEQDKRMCKKGHSLHENHPKQKCNQCKVVTHRICWSCHHYEKRYEPKVYDKSKAKYRVCNDCGIKNLKKVTKTLRVNQKKEKEIIAYYERKPHLAVDLMCNLNTKPALQFLLREIVVSSGGDGERYSHCLWSFDIDNFRNLNEKLGHDGADVKLQQIGQILKKYTKKTEEEWKQQGIVISRVWAFRPGGDEFIIITKGENKQIKTQKRFYDLLKKEINGIKINISVGVLVYAGVVMDKNCTAANWLKWVDEALYAAKDVDGKNSLRIYDGAHEKSGKGYKGKVVETFKDIRFG